MNETDASGVCLVKYKWSDKHTFTKVKDGCVSMDLPFVTNPQRLLESIVESSSISQYTLDNSNAYLVKVFAKEKHVLYTTVHGDIGGELEAEQTLTLKGTHTCKIISANSLQGALDQLDNSLNQDSLTTEPLYAQEEQKQFTNAVNNFRDFLQPKLLSTLPSAKAFVHLVRLARRSSKEDIFKALGAKKNQPIL